MILFDPDLDSHPSPKSSSAKRSSAQKSQQIPTPRALARFLNLAQAAVRLRGQVTVLLTTDAAIRSLNRRFRGKNKATDVLSFPAEMAGPVKIAGDIAISVPTARRQGAAHGHSLGTEIKVLILHGLLHLAGFDHEVDEGKMARRERLLRGRLGLPQGLIERVEMVSKTSQIGDRRSPTLAPKGRRKDGAPGIEAVPKARRGGLTQDDRRIGERV